MSLDINQEAFVELVKAGLFPVQGEGIMVNGSFPKDVDWGKVYQLAQEQSVQGLALHGMEELRAKNLELRVPQGLLLQWIGEVQMIEKRNLAMNDFVSKLIEKLRKEDVYAILVKGQGIAQSYERPLWRASGDVDLLLSNSNYERAKDVLIPLADEVEHEFKAFKHLGMMINGFEVELHGSLHTRLSKRIERGIDEVQDDVFYSGKVRAWTNGNTTVFLPAPDNDVIFIFTHILHHFFIDGIGLRQICDWCRLLWTYKDSLNCGLLESRLRKMGLMSEWKAFAAFAVEYLGMPVEAMPLYSNEKKWSKKAEHILEFVLESGNFGHNREKTHGKMQSAFGKMKDFTRHARIFPVDSIKFFWHFLWNGVGLTLEK